MIGIVLAALLWGTTGTAATLLPASVGPLATGAATMCLGGLLLAVTAPRATLGVLRGRSTRGSGTWRWLVPGALGVAVYPLAFYSSMSLAGVAVGNVVALGTAPVFAAVLERLVVPAPERRALDLCWVLGAGSAVVGVALLAAFGQHQEERSIVTTAEQPDLPAGATDPAGALLLGVVLGVVAGLAYATYTITAGRLLVGGAPSRGAMAGQFGLGAVLLLPVLLATGAPILGDGRAAGPVPDPFPGATGGVPAVAGTPLLALLGGVPHPALVVAYLALGPMFLAYLAFGRGLRTVPGSRATTVTLLEPVVATLLAVVAVGERLAPLGWVGLVLVLAGVAGVVLERGSPTPVRAPA